MDPQSQNGEEIKRFLIVSEIFSFLAFKFRATNAWNSLLFHFQRAMSTATVFSGLQAVNILYEFVSKNPDLFNNTLVTREKIVKVSQKHKNSRHFAKKS